MRLKYDYCLSLVIPSNKRMPSSAEERPAVPEHLSYAC